METKDKVLSFHEKLENFIENNIKLIFAGVIAFLVLGILWLGISYYYSKKESEATKLLLMASQSTNKLQIFNQLVKKFPHTQAGMEAALSLWNYYYSVGDLSKMKELYKVLKEGYPSQLMPVLLYGKAKILEEEGSLKKAIDVLKDAVSRQPELGIIAYLDLGRLYQEVGNVKQAKFYYKQAQAIPELEDDPFIKYKLWELKK